jgi:hypothetical protein
VIGCSFAGLSALDGLHQLNKHQWYIEFQAAAIALLLACGFMVILCCGWHWRGVPLFAPPMPWSSIGTESRVRKKWQGELIPADAEAGKRAAGVSYEL